MSHEITARLGEVEYQSKLNLARPEKSLLNLDIQIRRFGRKKSCFKSQIITIPSQVSHKTANKNSLPKRSIVD